MPIGGSANFLLGIDRPIIYCLEYPLIQKKEKMSEYGRFFYKIGISTKGINRLNTYLTYFPFSYILNYVLVFQKDSIDLKELQKIEKYLFSLLKSKQFKARPLDQTVRMNRAPNQLEDDTREFWEIDETDLALAFKKTKEYIKSHLRMPIWMLTPNTINEYYRLTARNIPTGIRLTKEEETRNRSEINRISARARDMLSKMTPEQKDMFLNPSRYLEISDDADLDRK